MAIVLNVGLKMNPALVGLLMALPRFTDAFTDPIMGYISDRTRCKWGRRRPYIFWGALAAGIILALLWQLPAGHSEMFYFWFFLVGSILYFAACTVYSTPWVALGYEMTPDYHERTRLMGFSNFMGQAFFAIGPWFYAFMNWDKFQDQVQGAKVLAIVLGVFVALVGILPAIFGKEPMKKVSAEENKTRKIKRIAAFRFSNYLEAFKQLVTRHPVMSVVLLLIFCGACWGEWIFINKYIDARIIWDLIVIMVIALAVGLVYLIGIPALNYKTPVFEVEEQELETVHLWQLITHSIVDFLEGLIVTFESKPFLKLCAATFFLFNGFMLVSGLGSYITIYYVFGGDTAMGGVYMGYFGTISSIATFCVIPLVTWLSRKIGKRRAFMFATMVSIVGYGLKWWCYNPAHPKLLLIPAPLVAFGLGSLFTLVGAMMGDVCDLDELHTGHRREGVFGAIYWWMVKLGVTLAFAFSGFLLNSTGFDVELEGNQLPEALLLLRVYDILIPIATTLIAIFAIYSYKITESRAHEIRAELEKRRGAVAVNA
jgi:Na+/melibiose symporter-like transporter